MKFSAVIFDSDGVLVDSEVLGIEIEIQALSEIGLNYEKAEFIQRFMGLADADFTRALEIESQERLGVKLPGDFADVLITRKDALYPSVLQAVPGIKKLLEPSRVE